MSNFWIALITWKAIGFLVGITAVVFALVYLSWLRGERATNRRAGMERGRGSDPALGDREPDPAAFVSLRRGCPSANRPVRLRRHQLEGRACWRV